MFGSSAWSIKLKQKSANTFIFSPAAWLASPDWREQMEASLLDAWAALVDPCPDQGHHYNNFHLYRPHLSISSSGGIPELVVLEVQVSKLPRRSCWLSDRLLVYVDLVIVFAVVIVWPSSSYILLLFMLLLLILSDYILDKLNQQRYYQWDQHSRCGCTRQQFPPKSCQVLHHHHCRPPGTEIKSSHRQGQGDFQKSVFRSNFWWRDGEVVLAETWIACLASSITALNCSSSSPSSTIATLIIISLHKRWWIGNWHAFDCC